MKKLLLLVLLGNGILVARDIRPNAADSLPKTDTVRVSPYLAPATSRSLGNFAVIAKDKLAFQTNAGFSILNTLRGHTPNLDIGPNYTSLSTAIRSSSSHYVVDGLPYVSDFSSYYNLNSFDFESISAVSSGNGASVYGGAATGGAFIIESKSGKDVDRTTIEVNSTSSLMWVDNEPLFIGQAPEVETIKQWRLSNAVAFAQDFGAVDTRVSYTHGLLPDNNTEGENRASTNNFKINTGVDIVRGLRARLILDHNSLKNDYSYNATTTSNEYKNSVGNLLITYKVLDWLTISSQSSLAALKRDGKSATTSIEHDFNRKFVNLFVSFKKSFGGKFGVTAFSGVQYQKTEEDRRIPFSTFQREYVAKTWSVGTGVQVMNAWFVDFNYRRDYLDLLPLEESAHATYSLSTALNVLDLFRAANHTFSGVRIRGSYGDAFDVPHLGYPTPNVFIFQKPTEKKMKEAGIDLSFLSNRITFTTNYFYNIEHVTTFFSLPGYGVTVLDLGDLYVDGWELILSGASVQSKKITLDTKLIWSNYNAELQYLGAFEPFPGTEELGNPYPDWRSSLLNQLTIGRFFTTFLIDLQKGGSLITYDFESFPQPQVLISDGSMTRLRDISFGYELVNNEQRKIIRQAQLSLSFRNIWLMYSKSDVDAESIGTLQKSVNLSLSVRL